MDKLEQAMQSEDFWVELADTSFGKCEAPCSYYEQ